MTNTATPAVSARPVFIACAASAAVFGHHCFLGASYDRKEANSMKGRSGWVERFESADAAIEANPDWEMSIMCEL